MSEPRIVVSVVSHNQSDMIAGLLQDLGRIGEDGLEVILTLNVPEALRYAPEEFGVPVCVLRNSSPRGFAANHNAAAKTARGRYFCVVNPDIRLCSSPFPVLTAMLDDPGVALAAPLVLNPDGLIEDSARRFPTAVRLAEKLRYKLSGRHIEHDYPAPPGPFEPDWVGGMFMMLRNETFASIGGFDERYFLYYEDVELCGRLRLAGKRIVLQPDARVVHEARRDSHRRPRHAWWHIRSIARWLLSPTYRGLRRAGLA